MKQWISSDKVHYKYKTKQPKTLLYTIANTRIQTYMFSCKQYYKDINNLHISKLTVQRTQEKHIQTFKVSFFHTYLFSNIQRIL